MTTPPSAGSTARRSARSRRCSTCWPTPSSRWRASRSVSLHAAWAVDALPADDALAAAAVAKAYCARAARTVCETAIQVHGGIGNTWECLAHVYLRRALLSSDLLGGVGRQPGPRARPPRDRRRRWTSVTRPPRRSSGCGSGSGCTTTTPGCPRRRPTTTTGPGRRPGTSRSTTPASSACRGPTEIGGHGLPSVYDVILDDELAAAGAPPRPEPRLPGAGHPRARQRRHQAAVPARHRQRARPLVPGLQRARRRLRPRRRSAPAPIATATSTSSPATRSGRATPTTPTGASCWPAPTTTSPSTRASRPSPCRWASPASSSGRCG